MGQVNHMIVSKENEGWITGRWMEVWDKEEKREEKGRVQSINWYSTLSYSFHFIDKGGNHEVNEAIEDHLLLPFSPIQDEDELTSGIYPLEERVGLKWKHTVMTLRSSITNWLTYGGIRYHINQSIDRYTLTDTNTRHCWDFPLGHTPLQQKQAMHWGINRGRITVGMTGGGGMGYGNRDEINWAEIEMQPDCETIELLQ